MSPYLETTYSVGGQAQAKRRVERWVGGGYGGVDGRGVEREVGGWVYVLQRKLT